MGEQLGLGSLINTDAVGRQLYIGWYADRTAKPCLTSKQWSYLLEIDPALQSLVNRGIITAEPLADEECCDAQLDEWNTRNTPRSQGIEKLPRKAVADTAEARDRIRSKKRKAT